MELLAAVGDERRVDAERADEVADDQPDRAPVEDGDEDHHRGDRDQHVADARDRVGERALLDPEERGHHLVVGLRPEADRTGAGELGVVAEADPVAHRPREHEAEHEAEARHAHDEPERGAHDVAPVGRVLAVEVETEERARDPHLQHDREHRSRRGHDLDPP